MKSDDEVAREAQAEREAEREREAAHEREVIARYKRNQSIAEAHEASKLFLCYAREDAPAVLGLYSRLTAAGLKPWIDVRDIVGGEDWKLSINRAIRSSHFFIACLSENSVSKRGTLQVEIKEALELWKTMLLDDIYIVPLRLTDCAVPPELAQFQWIDIFASDGFDRLEAAIRAGASRRRKS